MMLFKILLFIGIVLGIGGQLCLKKGMQDQGRVDLRIEKALPKKIVKMFINWFVISGVAFYGISALIWVVVLSKLDLSYAYPLVSINFVIVALFSKICFKENLSKLRWFSILIIMVGVILVSLS